MKGGGGLQLGLIIVYPNLNTNPVGGGGGGAKEATCPNLNLISTKEIGVGGGVGGEVGCMIIV